MRLGSRRVIVEDKMVSLVGCFGLHMNIEGERFSIHESMEDVSST